MPRKRKRLKGFIADCTRFGVKLTSVAADGVPVPGLKGAAGRVSMLFDKFEARTNNLDGEKRARDRGKSMCEQITQLWGHGQLAQGEAESYLQRLMDHLEELPDLTRKKKLDQLVGADKYAQAIADCNTALDRLYHDIELEIGRKSLAISRAIQLKQDDVLQGVKHLTNGLDRKLSEMQESLVIALRQPPEQGKPSRDDVKLDMRNPSFPKNTPLSLFVLFSTQGSQVPGWD